MFEEYEQIIFEDVEEWFGSDKDLRHETLFDKDNIGTVIVVVNRENDSTTI